MRSSVSLLLLSALFLAGCANHGVIVQKESRPHPFYESVGVEGMYTFVLRDEAGATHRQMVTPEVYERYAIGDNFNDEQLAPAANDTSAEPKTVQVAMHRPTFAVGRMASATKAMPVQRVAAMKSPTTKTKIAQRSPHHASKQIASRTSTKKTSHARVASHSRKRAKLIAAHAKKSKTVAAATKTAKPWKLTAPTVESATSQPASPAEGPAPAKIEKPALRETQITIPDSQ